MSQPMGDAVRQLRDQKARYREGCGPVEPGNLAASDNAAQAPGKLCELCGQPITAGQDARLRPDGWWIHEACPAGW
jgi:hypothetical protein